MLTVNRCGLARSFSGTPIRAEHLELLDVNFVGERVRLVGHRGKLTAAYGGDNTESYTNKPTSDYDVSTNLPHAEGMIK